MAGEGTIKIDPDAASNDLTRIAAAKEDLRKAKIGLVNVRKRGRDDCKGELSKAIDEKALELLKLLDSLVDNLEATEAEINKTVQEFEELDRQMATNTAASAAADLASAIRNVGSMFRKN